MSEKTISIDIDRMVISVTVIWLGFHFLGALYLIVAVPAFLMYALATIRMMIGAGK